MAQIEAPKPYGQVTVIGAGSWGTALAATLARGGAQVRLWGRDAAVVAAVNDRRETPFLPGLRLPEGISAGTDLSAMLAGSEAVLLVTPSHSLRGVAERLREMRAPRVPLLICAKGIETGTGLLLSEVIGEILPGHPVGVLSGPCFAREAAEGHPTAATIAFPFAPRDRQRPDLAPATRMAATLGSAAFRPYVSDDVVGVEIGGAVKNVIAIACGMMAGAGFAENTRALLITRGLAEMQTLATALGARPETMAGLSGVGDLTLTCSSATSRNMSLGLQLGQGLARAACFDGRRVVVEGEVTARSVVELARRLGLRMPISEAVFQILEGADLAETFARLWAGALRGEGGLGLAFAHPSDVAEVDRFYRGFQRD